MRYIKTINELFDQHQNKKIGRGTEGVVVSDGEYAYKIVQEDLVGDPEDIKKYRIIDHPHIVRIYDAWYLDSDNDYVVIKMELLDPIPDLKDVDEYNRVSELLWYSEDNVNNVKKIKTDNPEIQKMLDAILSAYDTLGSLDVGFHNLMYDSKTGNYKQVDIV